MLSLLQFINISKFTQFGLRSICTSKFSVHHQRLKNAGGLSQFFKLCLGQDNPQRHWA